MNLVNKNVGSAAWETLLAGNFPVKTRTITLKKPDKEVLFAVSDADVPAVVAVTGEFVQDHIIFADGTKADDVRLQAEDRNIYFRKLVNVDKGEE